jgi:hypothetical protein
MSPRSDTYRQRAAEAKNRAPQVSNPHVKTVFEEVARVWLLLAGFVSDAGRGLGAIEQEAGFSEPRDYIPRNLARDVAHALAGPVAINGARAGMTLEIRINRIRTGRWGWSAEGSAAHF